MRSSFATFVMSFVLALAFGASDAQALDLKKLKNNVLKGANNALDKVGDTAKDAANGVADGVTDLTVDLVNRQNERYGQPKLEKAEDKKASSDEKAADPKKKESIADKFIKAAGCNGPKNAGWTERCGKNALTVAADKRDADKKTADAKK